MRVVTVVKFCLLLSFGSIFCTFNPCAFYVFFYVQLSVRQREPGCPAPYLNTFFKFHGSIPIFSKIHDDGGGGGGGAAHASF